MSPDKKHFTGAGTLAVILLLALLGTFSTGFLTYRHVILVSESDAVGESFLCRSEGYISCDSILLTEYAVLFGHVSSAALGLMGFVFVLWCAVNGLVNPRLRKLAWVYLILYFCAALGFSWYYLYVMAFHVDFVCPWCLVVHAVNITCIIILLVGSVKRRKEFLIRETATWGERIYFTVCGLVGALAVFLAAGMIEKTLSFEDARVKYEDLRNDPVVTLALLRASPDYEVPINPDDPVFGAQWAPFPIILFTDYACPVCAELEVFLRRLALRNPQQLRIVYKNFPLSTKCNEYLLGNLHPNACPAARAAYAAFMLGGNQAFQVYTHLLFANRKRLADEPYDEFAKEVGLDLDKFRALNKPGSPADEKVMKDIEEGNRLRLNATPQLFFLNKKLPSNYRGAFLVHLLEDLIREYRPEAGEVKLYLPGT